jgi:hypothetical protein
MRESRFQEAAISCAVVLEALAYQYWDKKTIRKRRGKDKRGGMSPWLRQLNHPTLQNEFNDAADLWLLRNEIVHDQKLLTNDDIELIMRGLKAMGKLRWFFLDKIAPEQLKISKRFAGFFEQTPITSEKPKVGKFLPVSIQWRRETDHYEEYKRELKQG